MYIYFNRMSVKTTTTLDGKWKKHTQDRLYGLDAEIKLGVFGSTDGHSTNWRCPGTYAVT